MIIEQIEKNIFIPTYFTDMFKYVKEKNQFVSNKSNFKNPDFFSPIYKNDLATVGFNLRSSKSGKTKTFYLTKIHKENSEIQYWIFTDEETGKITIKIVNQ